MLWPLKWEKTSQKRPPKGVLQNCVWKLLSKLFKYVCEGVTFSKSWNERFFRYIPRIFISVVKELRYVTDSLQNTFTWLLATFELIVTRALQVYVWLPKYNTRISEKRVAETLLNIPFTVKTEYPNARAPKKFFNEFKF